MTMSLPRLQSRETMSREAVYPGPSSYTPNQDVVHKASQRTVFGTSKRENEAHRFISNEHAQAPADSPGPGTYRTNKKEKYNSRYKSPPGMRFGGSPQREPPPKEALGIPGPIYDLETEPPGPQWSMAPGGRRDLGVFRTRDDNMAVFISRLHSQVDKAFMSRSIPGAGRYHPVFESESKRKTGASHSFPRNGKDAAPYASLTANQLEVEPLSTTMKDTPGAIYELPEMMDKHGLKFTNATRFFSPELGRSKAGPLLAEAQLYRGAESPGSQQYNPRQDMAILGAPSTKFGSPTTQSKSPTKKARLPGPGAYNAKEEHSSQHKSAPSFTMAPNLRSEIGNFASLTYPGPGKYNPKDDADSVRPRAPQYTLTGGPMDPHSYYPDPKVPSATQYHPNVSAMAEKGGYTFGMRERRRDKDGASMIGVRYHGPLAALEALGSESPSPGTYDIGGTLDHRGYKFLQGERSPTKVFISREHAAAECMGTESPGPGAYNVMDVVGMAKASEAPAFSFGSSNRFAGGAAMAENVDPFL